jgi:TolB protein
MNLILRFLSGVATATALTLVAAGAHWSPPSWQPPSSAQQPPPSTQQPPPSQPQEVRTVIRSEGGAPSRFAVPDFVPLSPDAETAAIAKTISQVLWDDLNFEREFSMIPRDTYATIPAAKSLTDVPFDRWRELGADGVIIGTVQKSGTGVRLQVRLYNIASRESAFGQEYTGGAGSARLYAHTISDEIHQQQRGLRGVARTKLAFDSDRSSERMTGTVEHRDVKEVFISDYDGDNQRQVTTNRSLNITATWSPDGRSIAYTSYRHGVPNIFISNIYQGTLEELTKNAESNFLPAWSPDGARLCFMSNRDGNPEIYIANRDGSNVKRLTYHPANDSTCTWSPSGKEIAFTSDRTGSPQIYVVGIDGLAAQKITTESYCDRPTWSPAPYNEIAYTSRDGPGMDIKVIDLTTKQVRQITFGEGSNESPSWAPNGRHIAFMSTRAGKHQIFTVARDGKDVRQVTKAGNNYMPDWSK